MTVGAAPPFSQKLNIFRSLPFKDVEKQNICSYNKSMEIVRATRIKIDLPVEIAEQTIQTWNLACNLASRAAYENGSISNYIRLHQKTYNSIRATGLSAQVAINAERVVAGAYMAAKSNKVSLKKPVIFKRAAVMLQGGERGRDFRFTPTGLSIWTTAGQIKNVAFHGEPKLTEYLADWRLGDARLYIFKGNVYLSVSIKKEVPDIECPNDAVVGIDRGLNYIATATDGKRAVFFGGGHVKDVRKRYADRRVSLQQRKAQKNTRSLRRVLKRLKGKEARFNRDVNHKISKQIVGFAHRTGNPTIALEKLDGIRDGSKKMRKKQRGAVNGWPFYQLEQFIRYKAAGLDFDVIEVDPRNTSKGCSRCGFVSDCNRYRHNFTCAACGYSLHADLNAARNIRFRGIAARQVPCGGGLPSISPEAREDYSSTGKLSVSADSN